MKLGLSMIPESLKNFNFKFYFYSGKSYRYSMNFKNQKNYFIIRDISTFK